MLGAKVTHPFNPYVAVTNRGASATANHNCYGAWLLPHYLWVPQVHKEKVLTPHGIIKSRYMWTLFPHQVGLIRGKPDYFNCHKNGSETHSNQTGCYLPLPTCCSVWIVVLPKLVFVKITSMNNLCTHYLTLFPHCSCSYQLN